MKLVIVALLFVVTTSWVQAQTFVANYDESKVPAYTLPDPLVFGNGKVAGSKGDWKKRRKEILDLCTDQMYGRVPAGDVISSVQILTTDGNACEGLAVRKEICLTLSREGKSIPLYLLLYLPKSGKKSPLFLGYNFSGNHTVSSDPGVRITSLWVRNNPTLGITNNRSNESARGADTKSWPVKAIIKRGFGVATLYYGDVMPDVNDGFKSGVFTLFSAERDSSSWGAVAAWAWGLSRVMDYLSKVDEVDSNRVMVFGHSRLGKAALWAGAMDKRFSIVISNESGSGGAALSLRRYGETVTRTNTSFPHWFCDNFKRFNNHEDLLPFDQHEVMALVAPRPLYVSTAEEDRWGDPVGSFLACVAASPVYKLLGTEGFPGKTMPQLESPVTGTIGYHIRPGKHDILPYDWQCFMDFADKCNK